MLKLGWKKILFGLGGIFAFWYFFLRGGKEKRMETRAPGEKGSKSVADFFEEGAAVIDTFLSPKYTGDKKLGGTSAAVGMGAG